ncbi:hypothetical protein ZWY2020_033681 [Hordeum vulgare]|nr:hypothetical protein ZWY2020_033681 [Hordeum vulgare]
MSSSTTLTAGKRATRKSTSPSHSLSPQPLAPLQPSGTVPLVPCPCCRFRNTIRRVSRSSSNPGHVYYKCPNHRVSPNPCNHYYWGNGEDNYVDFLVRNGYLGAASGTVAGDIASEETEPELEEPGLEKMADVVKNMDLVVKKMDELLEICINVFIAILFLIAVMLYVAVAK